MKTSLRILTLSLSLAALEAHAAAVALGTYNFTSGATNASFVGNANLGASVSYDATPTTTYNAGIFSFTDASLGGVTFANVGDVLSYSFTYSDLVMSNLTTPAFRTGFDFGSTAFIYHATSTGTGGNLTFYGNNNGNPFSQGTQVGLTNTTWSDFSNAGIRFTAGNTIDAVVSLTLNAINGGGSFDYLYEVTYTGGSSSNTASQVFSNIVGNNIVSIFHGANSSGIAANGNQWTVSNASMEFTAVPEPSTYALLTLAALGLGAHVVRRRKL